MPEQTQIERHYMRPSSAMHYQSMNKDQLWSKYYEILLKFANGIVVLPPYKVCDSGIVHER